MWQVTATFLVTLAPLVGASPNDQQAASLTIADNLLELSEQVFAGHADQLLTNPKNANVVYQAIEAVAALLMQTNNIQTFRCFALLNHIANLANLNKRGSACQQFANAAKKGPQPPKLQTDAFNDEFIHIDSRQMLTHDLKAPPGPYPLAEMFIRAVPSYNSMKTVLEGVLYSTACCEHLKPVLCVARWCRKHSREKCGLFRCLRLNRPSVTCLKYFHRSRHSGRMSMHCKRCWCNRPTSVCLNQCVITDHPNSCSNHRA